MKNALFWDVSSMLELLVIANSIAALLILFTLMMEAIRSSETPVLTRASRRHISEAGILQKHFYLVMDT
jgi:hypothetical protein